MAKPTDVQKQIDTLKTKISDNNKKIEENNNQIKLLSNNLNNPDNKRNVDRLTKDNVNLLQSNVKLQAKIVELSTVFEISKTQTTKIELDPKITALLPLYKDDLPTWERLSITNIPFLLFLTQWCSAGKNGGGFLRDPI